MSGFEWPPLPEWFWYPITFVYGAIVGSFLNVVIYRMPLGKSLNNPPSGCPNCNYRLTFWDNIPLLSFLFLRARCRDCRMPISWRYFCVELFTACLWTALYDRLATPQQISWINYVFYALFASILIAMVFIDLDHFIAPDELNTLAIGLGVGRDIVCLGLAWLAGGWLFQDVASQFLYFGWLPLSLVGALTYGGVLFLVSLLGFIYYAREENESLAQVTRRYFVDETGPEQGSATVGPGEAGGLETEPEAPETEEDLAEPPRLRFSPAFLCLLSAALLFPLVGFYALLFFLVPLAAFFGISRRPEETSGETLRRFFRSDDLGLPAPQSEEVAQAEAEANQFAAEAESGMHGGMGMGDVKLALGIGALLGPGLSLLSLLFATLFGAVTGVTLARIHARSLRLSLPFVPFMAAGAMVVMLYGPALIQWYLGLVNPRPPEPGIPPAVLRRRAERAARRAASPSPDPVEPYRRER